MRPRRRFNIVPFISSVPRRIASLSIADAGKRRASPVVSEGFCAIGRAERAGPPSAPRATAEYFGDRICSGIGSKRTGICEDVGKRDISESQQRSVQVVVAYRQAAGHKTGPHPRPSRAIDGGPGSDFTEGRKGAGVIRELD